MTHAGGIVFRRSGNQVQYLLIRARKTPGAWVFPKGHIEENESTEEAALREVVEEAGVHARIICPVGQVSFGTDQVQMFLMAFESVADTPAEREFVWLELTAALNTLSFADLRKLLRFADRLVPPH
jgi:8-oxo-dGTP pyrophosphatase MutT (NUDIX family)